MSINRDDDPLSCQTKPRLGYYEFFQDCERRDAKGEIMQCCKKCGRYRWAEDMCKYANISTSDVVLKLR